MPTQSLQAQSLQTQSQVSQEPVSDEVELSVDTAQSIEPTQLEHSQEHSHDASVLPKQDGQVFQELQAQQQQLQSWLKQVQRKIFDLETSYLTDEAQLGNLVKGWDLDGRFGPYRSRNVVEDRDRLFSFSSYSVYCEKRQPADVEKPAVQPAALARTTSQKSNTAGNRKFKKRKTDTDDWAFADDF